MGNDQAPQKRTRRPRALLALALAIVFAIFYAASKMVPVFSGGLVTISAVGFLLLTGTLFGELGDPTHHLLVRDPERVLERFRRAGRNEESVALQRSPALNKALTEC